LCFAELNALSCCLKLLVKPGPFGLNGGEIGLQLLFPLLSFL